MLLKKVCERAVDSIIDELVMVALTEKYPQHLGILVDALIELSEFDRLETHEKFNPERPDDHVVGGGLVFNFLAATLMTLEYGNHQQAEKLDKLLIHICSINSRFKNAMIEFATGDEDGPEAYRFELGDMAVNCCKAVMQAIR